jgi:hypothetical protein
MYKKMLLLMTAQLVYAASNTPEMPLHGKRFLLTRSQSVNAARDLCDWHRNFPTLCDTKSWWTSLSVAPEYIHSFRPERIAQYFFGTPYLQISGSQVEDRGYYDILADYFGLGQTFRSSVYLRPILENTLVDFRYHIGYDRYYFHIHAPVVWARTQIIIDECITNDGLATPFEPLYMDTQSITPVVSSFAQAISQGAVYGQVTEPLQFGRFGCPESTTKLSDIQMALGWIFLQRHNGWMSINLRGSIPTGTRPNNRILFEPIVGNGHHGELGIGFYGQGLLWQKDDDKLISLFLETNFTHLFGDKQCRSFDLCQLCDPCCPVTYVNGFGSSYILAKEFDADGNYKQQVTPLINHTTLLVKSSVDIQMDLAIMFAFDMKQWTFDIGYNGWVRTRERIELLSCLTADTVGLKGIQNVTLQMGGPSNVTQSLATLHGNNFAAQTAVADANSPIFVSSAQIDIDSGASSRMLTHKIFSYVQHTWYRFNACHAQSFMGVGFEVEFEGIRPKNLQPNKNSVSQWGVWVKAGVGY